MWNRYHRHHQHHQPARTVRPWLEGRRKAFAQRTCWQLPALWTEWRSSMDLKDWATKAEWAKRRNKRGLCFWGKTTKFERPQQDPRKISELSRIGRWWTKEEERLHTGSRQLAANEILWEAHLVQPVPKPVCDTITYDQVFRMDLVSYREFAPGQWTTDLHQRHRIPLWCKQHERISDETINEIWSASHSDTPTNYRPWRYCVLNEEKYRFNTRIWVDHWERLRT